MSNVLGADEGLVKEKESNVLVRCAGPEEEGMVPLRLV